MDNLIICSHCGSDACYVEEVNQDIKTYFCYGCGYQTNSLMKEGEEFYIQQTELLPELHKDLLSADEDGMVWMPCTVNVHDKGMVFANGSSTSDWTWAAVKAVQLQEGDKKVKDSQTHKMDMSTKVDFPRNEFMDALSYIGLLPE
jgi:hypothetical protein